MSKRNLPLVLTIFATALFVLYFSLFTIAKHRALYTAYFDLGIMDQVVYNTSRGRILQLTDPHGIENIYRMAIHNDIFLALLAPLYWVWQSPKALLVFQSLIVGTGAIALFLINNTVIKNNKLSFLISVSYLLYPALHGSVTYEFHAVTLATSFILWMFYFLLKKKRTLMIFFLLLALSTKESVGLTVGILILIHIIYSSFWQERNERVQNPMRLWTSQSDDRKSWTSLRQVFVRQVGLRITQRHWKLILLSIISIVWSIVSFTVIIPHFGDGRHVLLDRYENIGNSFSNIFISIFLYPRIVIGLFTNHEALLFYSKLLIPLGYVPLLSPIWLLALVPELLINLLSNNWATKQIVYHYTALITPVIFIALIYGIRRMMKWKIPNTVIGYFLIISSLFSWYLYGHIPFSKNNTLPRPIEYSELVDWATMLRDENIIVSGSNHTSPHLTQRKTFRYFPDGYELSDYIVIMTNDIYNDWKDKKATIEGYEKLKKDKRFRLVERYGRLEIYSKI